MLDGGFGKATPTKEGSGSRYSIISYTCMLRSGYGPRPFGCLPETLPALNGLDLHKA